jgi:DNA-binding MarR family transcriptional regulator
VENDRKPDAVDEIQLAWLRERPDLPVESIGVIARVWRAAKLLGDERRRTLARLGIDHAILDLLSTLRRRGAPYTMTPAELKDHCLVTSGAISQRVARAESAGQVEVRRSPGGRTLTVALTDKGHLAIEDTVERLLGYESGLLDHLTAAEREQLAELLRRLLDGLIAHLGADPRIAVGSPDPVPRPDPQSGG